MSSSSSEQTKLDLVKDLIDKSLKAGADAADAIVFESISMGNSWRMGKLEDVDRSESQDLGLRVFIGKQQATVSSNDLSPRGIEPLVERAIAMAKLAPEDAFCGLAPADRLAKEFPELDIEDTLEPSSERLVEMAREAEEAALAVKGVTNSNGAGAGWGRGGMVLATSEGFLGQYASTSHSVSCSVIAGEGLGMEVDYDYVTTRHGADLPDPASIGRNAGKYAVEKLDPRKADSQALPIVYDPRVSSTLVGHFAGAISGSSVARGTSFLKEALGEMVFAQSISIIDDPHRKRGLRSKPFDGEGVANRKFRLIDQGRLSTWLLDSTAARQLGMNTTGHAARGTGGPPGPSTTNLYMEPGKLSPEELIKDIKAGFYVTNLIGQGVNGVTGDYSRGAGGFWIENGEIAYPVNEVTIAGNLKDMFKNLTPANDLTFRYGTNAPTIRVEGMTLAGN